MSDLTEKSNIMCNKKLITKKVLKYFSFSFENVFCLGKMYLLPKTHKRVFNVPGRPVFFCYRNPTEKVSEFLDHHLQPVMKGSRSYVKDTHNYLEKLKHLGKILSNAILVTADAVGLYLSIPHEAGLEALYEKLEKR